MTLLKEAIPPVHRQVSDALSAFRSHRGIEQLHRLAEPKIKFIAQCFGYAIGRLDAMGETLEQYAPPIAQLLEDLSLCGAWSRVFTTLAKLDAESKQWVNLDPLDTLFRHASKSCAPSV
jgi:hypothetical protein